MKTEKEIDREIAEINEEIEIKEIEIEALKNLINDLKVKKINLLQKDQGYNLITDVMKNHFKL